MNFPDSGSIRSALIAVLLATISSAFADDIQDSSKFFKSGQYQQALERVNKALATKPKDAQARFLKGLIFAEQGNTKDASDVFLALTKDYPDLPEPFNNLAVIYASLGQYDKARSALEQSIRTHPSYATAYENLGDVYAKLASQAYDKALQIDAANPGAKNKLALVRELVGGSAPAKPVAVAVTPSILATPKELIKAPVAVAAAEAAKPIAEKPAAPKAGNAEILETVNAWAQAWSAKDVDGYLAFYGKDFKTPGGESRADWEQARRQRTRAPKSITVTVDTPTVRIAGEGQASVTFRQGYRSDVIKLTSITKTLLLARSEGRWLIQKERVGN
ncbi:MAG: tetratricopeptide repeat protein [Betaproteobacteria bacterium]|nr:tetratricopeptide repeat protein [Betaproteobacteria bacterium]